MLMGCETKVCVYKSFNDGGIHTMCSNSDKKGLELWHYFDSKKRWGDKNGISGIGTKEFFLCANVLKKHGNAWDFYWQY